MDNVTTDEKGFIKTASGAFINPNYVSQSGLESARSLGGGAAINTNTLSPVTPFSIPNPPTSTLANGVLGSSEALSEQIKANQAFTQEQTLKAQEAQGDLNTSRASLFAKMGDLFSLKRDTETQAIKDLGIEQKETVAGEAQIALERSQRALQNEIKALEGQGLTDVQRGQAEREINRKYASEQADLSLTADIAERRLTRAQTTAQKRVELALEPLKMQIEFQKMFYEENKDLFSKADQRAFETKLKEGDRNYEAAKTKEETLQKSKMTLMQSASSQGAGFDVLNAIQSAKTPEDAIVAAGRYSGDILDRQIKEAQLYKLNQETAKIAADIVAKNPKTNKQLTVINDINNILTNKAFGTTFGLFGTAARNTPGTRQYALSANVDNVINQLALAARGELKGQGAVSDFEGQMLKSAQTALSTNLSPSDAQKELIKVRGAIMTSSGLSAPVKITSPNGQVKYGQADSQIITDAISNGYVVEYQ